MAEVIYHDPLRVVRPGRGEVDLEGLWAGQPGFLVCGGPSLSKVDLSLLRSRGVVSVGVNNAAAWAPVKAWTFGDTQNKFHHGLFLDPGVMTFAPIPKLRKTIHVKRDGRFYATDVRVADCPNTYGYERRTMFVPHTFFTDPWAHWGSGKHQPPGEEGVGCLCTMLLGLRLLIYLGVRKVYLLGVDFCGTEDGKCYGFPNEKPIRRKIKWRYPKERKMLELLMPEMEKRGIEVFNVGPCTKLDLFPRVWYEDAIEDCCKGVGKEPLDTTDWYNRRAHREAEACGVSLRKSELLRI